MEGVREGAEAVRDKPREQARGLREEATAVFEEMKAQGASVVESAEARLSEIAEERKDAGVRQAEGLARTIRRAADKIEDSAPWMARYVQETAAAAAAATAAYVDGMARSVRDHRPRELVGSLEDLARRQPMAFFGAAALAGFAVARFARSSLPSGLSARHRGGIMGHGTRDTTNREGGAVARPRDEPGAPCGGTG